jgi:capsular polysaccharide biosynthesis protein
VIGERFLNRLGLEAVTRLGVPPRWTGYRHFRVRQPQEFGYVQVEAPGTARVRLPLNLHSRDQLSKQRGAWGFSFHDVPERHVSETYTSTLPDCRVVIGIDYRDQWRIPHYAVLKGRDIVAVRGTGPNRRLHAPTFARRDGATVKVPQAVWILEQWDQNYSHWLQWHLVKLGLVRKLGLAAPVLLPDDSPLTPVITRSVQMLGIGRTLALPGRDFQVEELTVIGMDMYRDSLLRDLRARLPLNRDPAAPRKVFISREHAERRRLANEADVWRILEPLGYVRVSFEKLAFEAQMDLMAGAVALFSLHGSGQANMLFAPEGMHVAEISDASFPNAQFYALAGALGHPYWLIEGKPAGELRPGEHDVVADLDQVREVAAGIEAALAAVAVNGPQSHQRSH